ncbi:MAG: hypothetical protein HGB36_10255 [Chlorobiaceae bacterium]|nr:hypothetical protein [Chlorobiaceae bacterium]
MAESVLFTGFPAGRVCRQWKCKAIEGYDLANGSEFCRDAFDMMITGQMASL